MTLQKLCREGEACLVKAAVPDASYDARALLLFLCGLDLGAYYLRADEKASPEIEEAYRKLIARRAAHEPLQYILNCAPFFGRDFFVTPDVLIPRFDSEILIDAILPHLAPGMPILDLCTGSGCLLLTLLLESRYQLDAAGSDISEAALSVAQKNAARYGLSPRFICSDLFREIRGKYAIILSNPPYIQTADLDTLATEVRSYEPHLALDGGADGLDFYRKIAKESCAHLLSGGRLFLEIADTQGEAVSRLLSESGFTKIERKRDLGGRDRVVMGVYAE